LGKIKILHFPKHPKNIRLNFDKIWLRCHPPFSIKLQNPPYSVNNPVIDDVTSVPALTMLYKHLTVELQNRAELMNTLKNVNQSRGPY